jgi:hypothetical protein
MWVGFAQQWHWLDVIDRSTLDVLHTFGVAHPGWVAFWDVFCTVLGPTAFRLFALALIVVALARRNLRAALFLVISVELSGLVTEAAKAAANRPRPAEALVHAPTTSAGSCSTCTTSPTCSPDGRWVTCGSSCACCWRRPWRRSRQRTKHR